MVTLTVGGLAKTSVVVGGRFAGAVTATSVTPGPSPVTSSSATIVAPDNRSRPAFEPPIVSFTSFTSKS